MDTKKNKLTNVVRKTTVSILFLLILTITIISIVNAQPTGITISGNVTETKGITEAANRTDPGGSITTLIIDVLQQNLKWKAYVGNISGVLTLDDANGYSIFQWDLGDEVNGEIYISRHGDLTWTNVACANLTEIETEDTFLGFTNTSVDSINKTYNETLHPQINIGVLPPIAENTCRSVSTYVNDTAQTADHNFPALLLASESKIIYATPINQGQDSYKTGTLVDFQIILANNPASTTLYYFYAEIGA